MKELSLNRIIDINLVYLYIKKNSFKNFSFKVLVTILHTANTDYLDQQIIVKHNNCCEQKHNFYPQKDIFIFEKNILS